MTEIYLNLKLTTDTKSGPDKLRVRFFISNKTCRAPNL